MERIGLVVVLSFVALGSFTAAAPRPDDTAIYKGFISDKQCGATIDADCNKRCFERGETPVLVVDGTGAILDIANAERVTDLPGAHVEIKGTIDPKEKKLIVAAVKAL
jgi:hypothetical protein